jgi:PIN domain nuclease of toxin-antitoxin system
MGLEPDVGWTGVQSPASDPVTLLDTNAVIWLDRRHKRARPLLSNVRELYVSPASLLELQYLHEAGRIQLRDSGVLAFASHQEWQVDEPPAVQWFEEACELGWTRDPFDRLIVAHAAVRGWRLATGDDELIARLPASRVVKL